LVAFVGVGGGGQQTGGRGGGLWFVGFVVFDPSVTGGGGTQQGSLAPPETGALETPLALPFGGGGAQHGGGAGPPVRFAVDSVEFTAVPFPAAFGGGGQQAEALESFGSLAFSSPGVGHEAVRAVPRLGVGDAEASAVAETATIPAAATAIRAIQIVLPRNLARGWAVMVSPGDPRGTRLKPIVGEAAGIFPKSVQEAA
jgi:hypothetical protein